MGDAAGVHGEDRLPSRLWRFSAWGALTDEQTATVEPLLPRLHSAFLAVAREPCDAFHRRLYGIAPYRRATIGEPGAGTQVFPLARYMAGRFHGGGHTIGRARDETCRRSMQSEGQEGNTPNTPWRYPCHEYSRSAPPLASLSPPRLPRPDPRWPHRRSFTPPRRPQRSSRARSPIGTAETMATATASATSVHDTYPRVR